METLDCRGQACPRPVVETKNFIEANVSVPLEVLVDNDAARTNVSRFAASRGYRVAVSEGEGHYRLTLTPGETVSVAPEPEIVPHRSGMAYGPRVVLFGSETLGRGNEQLGQVLAKGFFYTLTQADQRPDCLVFINSGVRLSCLGSPVLDSLEELAALGCRIISCGTCLDYFGLKEQLAVGEVGNMYSIVDLLNRASHLITLN
ncbi:MAG: sulfurtransferase-like selenium metabolism protein YedF [Bacillota bacterium]